MSRKQRELEAKAAYQRYVASDAEGKKDKAQRLLARDKCSPDIMEKDKPKYLFACPENTYYTGTKSRYTWLPRWMELQPSGEYKMVHGRPVSSFSEALAKTLFKLEMWSGFAKDPDPRL